jgi:hypothetical protein
MSGGRSVAGVLLAGAAGLLTATLCDRPAQAQTIFCPSAIPSQSGIALNNGTCTNGVTGAFSNAALASEALSDLSESTTQQASATVGTAIGLRRQAELERCPEGFERVNGACRRIAAAAPPEPPPPPAAPAPATLVEAAPPSAAPGQAAPTRAAPSATARRARTAAAPDGGTTEPVARPRPAAPRVAARPVPFYKAPPLPIEPAVRYATWVQGYGDYERRTGTSTTSIICCTNLPGGTGLPNPLALSGQSQATMGGVLGGADATFRNLWFTNDGVILGALTGYLSSDVRLTTTSTASTGNVPNGASTLNAHLEGPSAGAYVTYFNERFSADAMFRADFLNLSESFIDTLGYTANVNGTGTLLAGTNIQSPFSGSGSTKLNNYTTTGNLNYRIPLSTISWIEPTAGVQFTQSDYDSSAAALGLNNGHLVKVQGGARYGIETLWGNSILTTTLTGLAYDDVVVTGGFIQNVAFGNNALIINDQGLLRGQGILAFNLAINNGVSLFAQGDVRGGQDLFGAGGKGGIRVTW